MPREIEPYVVEFRWSAWYVFGFCPLRQDFRRFKLGRLWNYRITETAFDFRPLPPTHGEAAEIFPEPYNVKILFDKSVRFRLIETYGLSCYEERDDGLFFSLDYANRDFIFSWILSFGEKAKVLEPQETVSEFAETAKKMFELYV
jgi:predicted DNA-binding transcriptional regulator YafY